MDHTPFEYGGLHFIPEQRFEPAGQYHSIIPLSRMRQDQDLAFHSPGEFAYSHNGFCKASTAIADILTNLMPKGREVCSE